MPDNTAKTVTTVRVWMAVAAFLYVCVWRGGGANSFIITIAAIGFGTATGAIWKRPVGTERIIE